jgi:gamma-glutamyl-gamma-aminobutyraldehyde dehydrogenase
MTRPTTRADWQARADELSIESRAFIDGSYVDSFSGATFDCISPVDGKVIAKVARGGAEDIERAVKASRKAFDDGRWSETSPVHR